jgi:hypothetical protein
VRQLWQRPRGSESALLVGRYGPACFYRVARQVVAEGSQPETAEARVVWLRGRA